MSESESIFLVENETVVAFGIVTRVTIKVSGMF